MTTHVFRKYAGYNPNEIKCWTASTVIDESSFDIEDIVFTRGASKAGTSIPSPLARMELFDTAFRIVADDRKNNLKGNTIYHQLVSDVLDVMQMLFNAKNDEIGIGKKIWFKEWQVRENIDKLKSRGEEHPNSLLAKSLEQIFYDSKNESFFGTDSIFLIYYENKLLGGTSPLTLFFTSPNWGRYIADGLIANVPRAIDGDVFFDNEYRALHERDETFITYLYKLYLQNRKAFAKADGLRAYINKTIETYFTDWRHNQDFQSPAGGDENTSSVNLLEGDYTKIITNVENKFLTCNGIYFYHQKEEDVRKKIADISDFKIRATENKYATQNNSGEQIEIYPPLVLVEGMNIPGNYMEKDSPWDPNTRVKEFYHRGIPLYERKLPMGNSLTANYPFLTTDDFLETTLIEMPFNINASKFYSGSAGDFKYLLPIKKEYFNFFNLKDLKNNLSITTDEGLVKVSLKIPIQNKKGIAEIVFTKQYNKQQGTIIECRAGMGIFPFYQINDSDPKLQVLNDYTVLLAERNEKIKFNALEFFKFNDFASETSALQHVVQERSKWEDIETADSTATSKFFKIKQAFDYIELSYSDSSENKCSGLIIPNFETKTFNKDNLSKAYTFAIDFGTSNTHIAWMERGEALPKPFEAGESDQQMVLLNAPGTSDDLGTKYNYYGQFPAIDLTLRREFLPALFTSKSEQTISYPFKTATCEIVSFNNTDKSDVDLFSHINIGYYIDKEEKKADNTIAGNTLYTTNLKWLLENNNDDANKSRVKFFLKQLLLQIKTKAILNNGRPDKLQIVWSVPLSMERGNKATLNNVLQEAFKEVFGDSGASLITPIPESVVPYFYLTKSDTDIQDTANVINIDIGGGTTDVMMFMESAGNRQDKYLITSFKFAGSDLWGGGYKSKLKDNGFIKNYFSYQKANNIDPKEKKYLDYVKSNSNLSADDLISLLFKYNSSFRFSDSILIGKPDLALILYLHYSAIIYHIVQIIELKEYPLPRYLSFTGKGSQYIKLICGGDEQELEAFTKLLLKAYTKQEVQSSFKIHLNDNPKEITANGSILYTMADDEEKAKYTDDFEFIHPGFQPHANEDFTAKVMANENNKLFIDETTNLDSPLNIAVLNNLNNFLELTLTNRAITDFLSDFKVKNPKTALEELKWNNDIFNGEGLIYDSYKKALKELHKQDKNNPLPESLFFFALKDSLYRLSKSIAKNN